PRDEATAQEGTVQIEIRVGDELFTATVDDTPAGRDLLAQFPQTIRMSDHGGVEKTGPLRAPLSLDGQPAGADPGVGDLGYYAPGSDLVLYYGDQSYYNGIVILGRLEGEATSRLAAMAGDITATVTATDAS
ncbi:MAG: cyclophilin-like fold protein, partial [Nocardioidaceae bacterium]